MSEIQVDIPEHRISGGWVVGGETRLLDVWSPSPLLLWAPAFDYPSHSLRFTLGEEISASQRRRRYFRRSARSIGTSRIYFDARHDATDNVAHVLQNQIGVALLGMEAFGRFDERRNLLFVIPPDTPGYARRLYAALGFEVLATDSPVSGHRLRMAPVKLPLRPLAGRLLRKHAADLGLLGGVADAIFVARRARRTLSNLDEVKAKVEYAGYRTVFLEDLSAEEQIRTMACAERIFGLHGAGLGFMLFRNPQAHGVVVECFSCGFATNWARAICSVVGDTWIGGQGALEPGVIGDMARGAHAHTHEARNYRLEGRTVDLLLKLTESAVECNGQGGSLSLAAAIDPVRVRVAEGARVDAR